MAPHRKGAAGSGGIGWTERRERSSGPSGKVVGAVTAIPVHQNRGVKMRKPVRSFLDPIFDVESDFRLQFGAPGHHGGHFAIDNLLSAGGSTRYMSHGQRRSELRL